MKKNIRLILSGILFILALILYYCFCSKAIISYEIKVIILSASFLILVFSFVIEVFFTKPVEIITTSISIILLLVPQRQMLLSMPKSLPNYILNIYILYCFITLIVSVLSQLLLTKEKPPNNILNRLSLGMKNFVEFTASSKIMYYLLGIMMISLYLFDYKAIYLLYLSYFTLVLILSMNQKKLQKFIDNNFNFKKKLKSETIGYIIGTESNDIYKAELFEAANINLFNNVIFRTNIKSMTPLAGIVIRKQMLNDCERFDILKTHAYQEDDFTIKKGEIQKTSETTDGKIIGLVCQNTNVSQLFFRYIPETQIEVGDVLCVKINGIKILYQVINGKVNVASLNSLDCDGFIVGEAVQLGFWNKEEKCFEMFGWTPEYNTIIYKSEHDTITKLDDDNINVIGAVPNTQYKISYDYDEGINHHLAILGVTGSGKSVFARQIIRNIIKKGMKVIAIDFTNEYIQRFPNIDVLFDSKKDDDNLFMYSKVYAEQMALFMSQRNTQTLENAIKKLKEIITENVQAFISKPEDKFALVEYPEMSNSATSTAFLKFFFESLFEYIRLNGTKQRLCIVLEEAHTIVPEWNCISGGDSSMTKQMVNAINQIALQGRKYNIGFIVVAQRTANVSKTILSQCNSIIAFQQFDNTSKSFLSNYFSPEMTEALPTLKKRHAIVAGKGLSSTLPVIIRVPDIENEPFFENRENIKKSTDESIGTSPSNVEDTAIPF